MTTYQHRLAQAMREARKSARDLAQALGISPQAVHRVVKGDSKSFNAENNVKAAQLLGVSASWLATGKREQGAPENAGEGFQYERIKLTEDVMREKDQPIAGSEDAIIRIPLLENAASMGDGEDALPVDMVAGHFPLSPAWVQQCIPNTATRALRFIHGRGDSMTPTIADGDIVLVDTTQRDPAAMDGVYVLRAADALYIKRVYQNLRGKLEVSSDNPAIKTVDVLDGTHEVEVLGRVIWVWGGRRV